MSATTEFNESAAADSLARTALEILTAALRDLAPEDRQGAYEMTRGFLETARGLLAGEVTADDLRRLGR